MSFKHWTALAACALLSKAAMGVERASAPSPHVLANFQACLADPHALATWPKVNGPWRDAGLDTALIALPNDGKQPQAAYYLKWSKASSQAYVARAGAYGGHFDTIYGPVSLNAPCGRTDLSPGPYFFHEDWELACDNTLTCRAAGYQSDEAQASTVSVLLTRAAGPGTPVQAQLQLGNYEDDPTPPKRVARLALRMAINGRALGTVTVDSATLIATLSALQTQALLDALPRRSTIEWSSKDTTWRLSDRGAAAVLLKMDEVQGRLDTPGALVRKGRQNEQAVFPPRPRPVVTAVSTAPQDKAPVRLAVADLARLKAELRADTNEDDCNGEPDDEDAKDNALDIIRLTPTRLLVSSLCWRGAYNEGFAYWLTNDRPPFKPVLITDAASGFSDGRIHASQKGRGLGDCLSSDTWTWDGQTFVHTSSSTTGMCKLITPGGAWSLPTLVSDVRTDHPIKAK